MTIIIICVLYHILSLKIFQKRCSVAVAVYTVCAAKRRALRSAGTKRLVVPSVRLSTVGSRAFPVAAAQIWNSLPEQIVSAPTLQSFKRHLKTFLLQQFFCL